MFMDIEDGMEIDRIEVYNNEKDGIGVDGIVGDGIFVDSIGNVLSSVVKNLFDVLDINCSIL
jgi:hypothetical protein